METTIKLCQSCIERGFTPPKEATREYQKNLFYCEDCFDALMENLGNISPEETKLALEDAPALSSNKAPLLDYIYDYFKTPAEHRYKKQDDVCRNNEMFFNFAAPSIVNKSIEQLQGELEEMTCSLFVIKFSSEGHADRIKVLKEERRKQANLSGIKESAEVYAKPKKAKSDVEAKKMEALARAMGLSPAEMQEQIKAARLKEFNKLVGNCTHCGGAMPCATHPNQ